MRDLERAVREFDARLSAGPWRGWVFGPQGEVANTVGNLPSGTLRLVLNTRSPQYELIEPLHGPSIHADWPTERGEGFHHVAYVVDSVAAVTAEMEAAGHPAIRPDSLIRGAGDGAAAYYETVDALGFLVEAVEPPREMPAGGLHSLRTLAQARVLHLTTRVVFVPDYLPSHSTLAHSDDLPVGARSSLPDIESVARN